MKTLRPILVALLLIVSVTSRADEGMWLIHDINEALARKMRERGLQLHTNQIYDADTPGASISDAVVSIGFHCTVSIISRTGLLMTNQRCAYSRIARLSTPERNYLEEGFWAMNRNQEIPIEGEKVYFLKKVLDVTSEVKALKKELGSKGQTYGTDRLKEILEKRYADAEPGLVPMFSSTFSGEKCFISFYKVYTDVRLVASPPLSIGGFGGDADSRQWPRHSCDFTIYRIYENGVPVSGEHHLKISLQGYQPFSFTMVVGFPGATDRNAPSASVRNEEKTTLQPSAEIGASRNDILRKWIESDPSIRLKYSDWFFHLCDSQESSKGKALCYKRFRISEEKAREEEELQRWIDSDKLYGSMWGTVIPDLDEAYSKTARVDKDRAICNEIIFKGTRIGPCLMRAGEFDSLEKVRETLQEGISGIDPRVERELLENMLEEFYTSLDSYYYGKWQKTLHDRFGSDFKEMADFLWEHSVVSSEDAVLTMTDPGDILKDPLRRFLTDCRTEAFNERRGHLKATDARNDLEKEFKRALYWKKLRAGEEQYPDADCTMRLSYGKVAGYMPADGVICNWFTTPEGILEKIDPESHDFCIDAKEKKLLDRKKWGKWGFTLYDRPNSMIVDFLSDNDVTVGSSGSPILNARGEIIGVASDGNYESLASNTSYVSGYNMCVSTDIRFVLWVLDRYAGMKRLVKELEFAD